MEGYRVAEVSEGYRGLWKVTEGLWNVTGSWKFQRVIEGYIWLQGLVYGGLQTVTWVTEGYERCKRLHTFKNWSGNCTIAVIKG